MRRDLDSNLSDSRDDVLSTLARIFNRLFSWLLPSLFNPTGRTREAKLVKRRRWKREVWFLLPQMHV